MTRPHVRLLSWAALALLAAGAWPPRTAAAQERTTGARQQATAAGEQTIRALVEVGRYAEAEAAARSAAAASPAALNTLGEVLMLRGKRDEAEGAYRSAIAANAPDRLVAELNLAEALRGRGALEEARRRFDAFIDVYNSGRKLSARELTAVATAVAWLGRDGNPALLKDALRAYDEAVAADPDDPEPRLRAGALLLSKYNSAQASDEFRAVLRRDPGNARALVGLAEVMDFDGRPGAADTVRKALERNPSLVTAHAFLARLDLDREDYAGARQEAERALEVNPSSMEALAVLAAARWLGGDEAGMADVERRAAALNPRNADFYADVAEIAVRSRRYDRAVKLARRALERDSSSSRALGVLGMDELRLGQVEPARRNLEAAFRRDPYNVWFKNTLDLLDTLATFRQVSTRDFRLVLDPGEADLLAPYVEDVAERAFADMASRYGYRPDGPVRVEVYPRHADFSVRTVGLVGLGALGVTFGRVVAMDSPSARARGDFNWASTLWHEMAHVFHLGITHQRVPRWFTEGLAVREERRAHAGWGQLPDPGFVTALKDGRLLPVSRLNDGFVRPTYPRQVVYSYYEASLAVELIEREHGFDAIRGMLREYGEGKQDSAVFRDVLKMEPAAFDARFDGWLRRRFATALTSMDEFRTELEAGRRLAAAGQNAAAKPHLERAKALLPAYAGAGSAYEALASIAEAAGDTRGAVAELDSLTRRNDSDYDARLRLAGLREKLGDRSGAAAALREAVWIDPSDPELHRRLANLYGGLGDRQGAVRERRAVVALRPSDPADAWYRLARALYEADDAAGARKAVLRSLEVAPDFAEAQALLLELQPKGGGA